MTRTEPQALTVEQLQALDFPEPWKRHPTWDNTVSTPYGVAKVFLLNGCPGNITALRAGLDNGDTVYWWKQTGWLDETKEAARAKRSRQRVHAECKRVMGSRVYDLIEQRIRDREVRSGS